MKKYRFEFKKWSEENYCVWFFSLFMTTFANASLITTINSVLDLIDQILKYQEKSFGV